MLPTILLTVNDRSKETLARVLGSLPDPREVQTIVVLDRPEPETRVAFDRVQRAGTRVVEVGGPAGWRNPGPAWNAGFKAVTTPLVYCISSDTVQAAGNVVRAAAFAADERTIVHGSVSCSCGPGGSEVNWGGTAPGNLFCDAAHPRPLGFIWCGPMSAVRAIDGYDLGFAGGFWHDDTDFFLRLWQRGLRFVFDDSVAGTHLHHERASLTPVGIEHNTTYFIRKHGAAALNPWAALPKRATFAAGRTTWAPL